MSEPNEKEMDADLERIKQAVAQLSEHFDSVQIFCTRHIANDVGTVNWKFGSGNWFARYGQVKDWVHAQEASTFIQVKKDSEQ